MTIEAIKIHTGKKPAVSNKKLSPAGKGAIMAASMITATNAAFWIAKPDQMNMMIKEYGGKGKYALNYAIGLAAFSAVGAAINTILTSIAKKTPEKKTPNAVN